MDFDRNVGNNQLTPERFILTHIVPTAVRTATRCGVNVLEFLQSQGISPLSLVPGHGALPMAELFHLINEGTRACWAAAPGGHGPMLFAETFNFDYLPDAAGYLFSSPTLKEASKLFNWVGPLYCPPARLEFHRNKRRITVVLTFKDGYADPAVSWVAAEAILAIWLKMVSHVFARLQAPEMVEFRHAAHCRRDDCDRFFGVACTFGAPRNAITLGLESLEQPLEGSIPDLHAYSKARLQRLVDEHTGRTQSKGGTTPPTDIELPDVTGLARRIFDHYVSAPYRLSGTITDLAKALDMPVRTLQRRLQADGTSFRLLQAKARLFIAKRRLLDRQTSIDDVATSIGFPDRRTFAAFLTRMTGRTPREWRRGRGLS